MTQIICGLIGANKESTCVIWPAQNPEPNCQPEDLETTLRLHLDDL